MAASSRSSPKADLVPDDTGFPVDVFVHDDA
jgi:hypothetical protein